MRRLASLLLVAACGGNAAGGEPQREVVVLAAASLTEAFQELGSAFEAESGGARVTFSFAGSQQLAGQIVQGAPVDVFASADPRQMEVAVEARRISGPPAVFARNVLAIAVEPGNPLGIQGLADLARPGVVVVLAAEQVPVGSYTRRTLEQAGVAVAPASLENDVRAVLAKVALGEADAGIVYASDIVAAEGDVEGIRIPDEDNVAAEYRIARMADAPQPGGAEAFIAWVLSEQGRAVLARHGFEPP
ncbi:MAG: molybdate ABC transporter substrate-binding protein [Actinomycetota bacterium]|nr:molybdate ABC transporter substrate-binding protein [Actinomycetota bacterium]